MSVPLHPDLEKDLRLVGVLVQVCGRKSCEIEGPCNELVARLLPILNGIESRVVAVALWSILATMAELARDRGEDLIAAENLAKGPVN